MQGTARVDVSKAIRMLDELRRRVHREIGNALTASANELLSSMRVVLNQEGTGKVYVIRGRLHQASAPGHAPAPFTATYLRSWQKMVEKSAGRAYVYTDDERGPWLEYGTSRMEPRPHARPTVKKYKDAFVKHGREALRRAAKKQ